MHKFVFTGPTLPFSEIEKLDLAMPIRKFTTLEDSLNNPELPENCFIVVPPVAGGDLYKMRDLASPYLVAIIDGYFENRISVWHKEILYLLSKNVPVFGSSSMGALRASEMARFGMIGIGKIYTNFADRVYEDDDEVTVSHGPAEAGFPQISEAMANIRFTVEAAIRDNILTEMIAEKFISVAKSTFYKKRNYGYIIRECVEYNNMRESDFSRFVLWLEKYRVDQKKFDAFHLIKVIKEFELAPNCPVASFDFEDTVMWRNAITA